MRSNQYLNEIFNNVEDSILVLGKDYRIVTCNPGFHNNFLEMPDIINTEISDFFKAMNIDYSYKSLEIIMDKVYSVELLPENIELCITGINKTYYNLNINPILSKKGAVLGKALLFSNITVYKALLLELDEKNKSLNDINNNLIIANQKLEEQSSLLDNLAVIRERNRLSEELQSTTGKTLSNLTVLLKECLNYITNHEPNMEKKLSNVLSKAASGLRDLRNAVRGISTFGTEIESLSKELKKLMKESGNNEINMEISIDINDEKIDKSVKNKILSICKEAIKNTVSHSNAKNFNLIIKLKHNVIKIYFIDDGKGCKEIVKGNGLMKMVMIVKELQGTIIYGSSNNCGFNIHIEFPYSPSSQ